MLPVVCGGSASVFVLVCITLFPTLLCNHLEEEEKTGCFAFIILLGCLVTVKVL